METCQSGRMDFTANEGSGLNSTGGSNPPGSARYYPRDSLENIGIAGVFQSQTGVGTADRRVRLQRNRCGGAPHTEPLEAFGWPLLLRGFQVPADGGDNFGAEEPLPAKSSSYSGAP